MYLDHQVPIGVFELAGWLIYCHSQSFHVGFRRVKTRDVSENLPCFLCGLFEVEVVQAVGG